MSRGQGGVKGGKACFLEGVRMRRTIRVDPTHYPKFASLVHPCLLEDFKFPAFAMISASLKLDNPLFWNKHPAIVARLTRGIARYI